MAYLGQSTMVLLPIPEPVLAPPAPPNEEPDYCSMYPEDCNMSPPYVPPIQTGTEFPEYPPYTLPIEIFEKIRPILVGRPEPEMMPIPTTLPPGQYYPESAPQQAGMSPLVIGALAIGALIALSGSSSQGRRKR